ncbi:hypothetical protein KX928_02210 [Roseobacter sp. YSTF-M11]|uniref:Secreted protein n=1 Tax=Roseobacter insulae TaxID=2859783 RepID=A0A9X1JWW3_9RHOB|nr:hypothetical protein [Roseobacter insulae]MBW4706590.1 hypothetical protein [Roseobacter insulae]
MHRKFIATIVAAALAVTAIGSAPARADEDLLRALAAIAGIAIVGKVIHDRNERKKEQQAVTRNTHRAPVYQNHNRSYDLKPRPLPHRANRRLLPGECLRSSDTRDGRVRYFGRSCLEDRYKHVEKLPKACKLRVKVPGYAYRRTGYDAYCLRQNGYQLARR